MSEPIKLNADSTADEAATLYHNNISGKTVVITGISPGSLGVEAAKAIAKHDPKLLVITGRSQNKLDEAERQIKSDAQNVKIKQLILDLNSLSNAKAAAEELSGSIEQIDVLINNAGIMASPYSTTEDGFESQFGVNHLAPFVFTQTLMPKLLASQHPRVVNITSEGAFAAGVRFDDPGFKNGADYSKWNAYAQAKSANILYALELAKIYGARGLTAYSVHPGAVFTGIFRDVNNKEDLEIFRSMGSMDDDNNPVQGGALYWKSPAAGASTHIYGAFDPAIKDHNGAFLKDCKVANDEAAPHTRDEESAAKLWTLSESLVGEKFK